MPAPDPCLLAEDAGDASEYFVAVPLPGTLLARLGAFWARWGRALHPVEPHVTLKLPFVWRGDPGPLIESVRAACSRFAPFGVRLGAPCRFRDEVLYLAVEGADLFALHEALVRACAPAAPPSEHELSGFVPHLTLAIRTFGADAAALDAMESAAPDHFAGEPAFMVAAVRCYTRSGTDERWAIHCDVPLGS